MLLQGTDNFYLYTLFQRTGKEEKPHSSFLNLVYSWDQGKKQTNKNTTKNRFNSSKSNSAEFMFKLSSSQEWKNGFRREFQNLLIQYTTLKDF